MACVYTSLISSGETLLAIDRDGANLISLDGRIRSRFSITKAKVPSVLCADLVESLQIAIIANYDGNLVAYDTSTGRMRWKRELERPVTKAVILPTIGLVVAGDVSGVQCMRIDDGAYARSSIKELSLPVKVRNGFVFSWRSGSGYISGSERTIVPLERSPDYVRKAMEAGGTLFVEFWKNEGKLFRYSTQSGELEGITTVEHSNFIHTTVDCDNPGKSRFLSAAADPKASIVWEVRTGGEMVDISTIELGGYLWVFHKGGELLVSMHGKVIEVASKRTLQEAWKVE
jgi:outer membrane protein assembly factor BamB